MRLKFTSASMKSRYVFFHSHYITKAEQWVIHIIATMVKYEGRTWHIKNLDAYAHNMRVLFDNFASFTNVWVFFHLSNTYKIQISQTFLQIYNFYEVLQN